MGRDRKEKIGREKNQRMERWKWMEKRKEKGKRKTERKEGNKCKARKETGMKGKGQTEKIRKEATLDHGFDELFNNMIMFILRS